MRTTATALLAVLALSACGDAAETDTEAGAIEPVVSRTEVSGEPLEAAETVAQDFEATPAPAGSLSATEMALGAEDAPLTVTEYASVTCGACAGFHAQVFPAIKEELVETGLVRFVYREFPTAPERLSVAGSMLARCAANDRGAPAYFAATDALYARQREWAFGSDPRQALQDIFGQVGMDRDAIEACLGRSDVFQKVTSNIQAGKDAGVNATPTLVIDGEIYDFRSLGSTEAIVADLRRRAEERG